MAEPKKPKDIALPKESYAWAVDQPDVPDVVNWPSPETRGSVGPQTVATAMPPTSRFLSNAPTSREAIDILRQRFRGFNPMDPTQPDAPDAPTYDDPMGVLATKAMRDIRAGELADRLPAEEAATFVPTEGYVQGEPGRRTRSNASAVMSAFLTRRRLQDLGNDAAADPFTGQAEQQRVGGIKDALTEAETLRRPELSDAVGAVSSRNAFANFLNKQKGYEADISDAGKAALDAASQRRITEADSGLRGGLKQIADPDHPGQTIWVRAKDAIGSAAPMPGAERTRFNTAQTVVDTANDIVGQLSDPNVAWQLGPIMGRYNSVRDWYGNPPPELAGLAAQIHSFSMANMGVHGMRSARGAELLNQLMTTKHTPESLIKAVQGLTQFSQHFVANASGEPSGGGSVGGGAAGGTVQMRAPDGSVQPVPAAQVEHYRKLGATVVQ